MMSSSRVTRTTVHCAAALVACAAVALAAVSLPVRQAGAQPTLSESASILFLPRIITETSRETVIEIANTSNSMVFALCLYLDGASGLQVNFDLQLTAQNSKRWNASEGVLCPDGSPECSFGPGLIPPLPVSFVGALICSERDESFAPLAGNHLVASATILDLSFGSGDAESYEAIGLAGFETGNGDNVLCLSGEPSDECPLGAEYSGCPDEWILNHVAEGAEDPLAGDGSSVITTLTFLNCGQDFETASAAPASLQFTITNELEQTFSASTTVGSWAESTLEGISETFGVELLGTTYAQTRIRSASGGVAIMAREQRRGPGQSEASAAFPLPHNGSSINPHAIILHPSLAQR